MDIRSFFAPKNGGKPVVPAPKEKEASTDSKYFKGGSKAAAGVKRKKGRNVIDSSSDEDFSAPSSSAVSTSVFHLVPTSSPVKPSPKKRSPAKKPKIEHQEVDPATFFAEKAKSKTVPKNTPDPTRKSPARAAKGRKVHVSDGDDDNDADFMVEDDKDNFSLKVEDGDATDVDEDVVDAKPAAKKRAAPASTKKVKPSPKAKKEEAKTVKEEVVMVIDSDAEGEETVKDPITPVKGKRKLPPRVTHADKDVTPKQSPSRSSVSATKRKLPAAGSDDDAEATAEKPAKKFNFREHAAKKSAGPSAPGSKEIPEGKENCLAGVTLVFSGDLSSISRDDATSLAKRYGARVTSALSGKTSFLVLGDLPGASKLKKAEELNLKTLDEDGFLDLIRTRPAKSDAAAMGPAAKGKAKGKSSASITLPSADNKGGEVENLLWTTKYKPRSYADVVGNGTAIQALGKWLRNWEEYRAKNFKRQAGDENSCFKAALISGPPGIGKTTAAHLVAELEGFDVLEFNASDTRSKKSLDAVFRESTGSHAVTEYFGDAVAKNAKGRSNAAGGIGKRRIIIMDEVDGMSAGDRGGLAELVQLLKKSRVPVICICNDRSNPKMKTLAAYCVDMRFKRATHTMIQKRLLPIAQMEGLELKPNTVEQLVASTGADIRQILNLLSTYRLTSTTMTYDQSVAATRASEKDVPTNTFDATGKLFSGVDWNRTGLDVKMQYYFSDSAMMPLFVQECYARTQPAIAQHLGAGDPKKTERQTLACIADAADSISLADNVDRLLRGGNNWTLMNAHNVLSTVRPCFFTHGRMSGGMTPFPQWFGKNSSQTKATRQLKEIQSHMRTHVSGTKRDVRLTYLPVLAPALAKPLITEKQDAIEGVIDFMDEYWLTRDDWDSVMELGMGTIGTKALSSKIDTNVKTAFTRAYNKGTHPNQVPLMGKPQKNVGGAAAAGFDEAPDNEDVALESAGEESESGDDGNDGVDGDKMIKVKTTAKPATAGKGKATAASAKAKASGSGVGRKKK
ncbi:hypothetical protein HKX48_000445 [Thoreauomyces humboldtii]|nr:hypothetical protein HKX48_000445 [Thoreauomyces humboldtii]